MQSTIDEIKSGIATELLRAQLDEHIPKLEKLVTLYSAIRNIQVDAEVLILVTIALRKLNACPRPEGDELRAHMLHTIRKLCDAVE